MTCTTCHKEITKNSFYESGKYFCTKDCKDEYRDYLYDRGLREHIEALNYWIGRLPCKPKKEREVKGFDTVFDETVL